MMASDGGLHPSHMSTTTNNNNNQAISTSQHQTSGSKRTPSQHVVAVLDHSRNQTASPQSSTSSDVSEAEGASALQQHVLFWDRDNDDIIHPTDVYNGFRDIGFSIPFSILALLIPFFFSYPTTLGHSYLPDPRFRIYVKSIHKAKHGSDTGIYDSDGAFRLSMFKRLFARFDSSGTGSLGAGDLFRLLSKNRVAADPAGWTFGFMEWSTTWLLLQRDGRVWEEDLRQCYDGTLFWKLRDERLRGVSRAHGYGLKEFLHSLYAALKKLI